MRLKTYPFRQHALIIKKKKKKKKGKERNAVQYKNKQPFIQGTKETQKKRRSKNPKTKTYSPIKIHTRSDYKLFSVPSDTQIGLELQQKRRYRERRKDRKSSNTPKK